MLDISFAKPALPKSGALVLPIAEGEARSELFRQADAATGGAVTRALEAAEFKAKRGGTCNVLAPGAGLSRVLAVGLGKIEELTPRLAEEAGGTAAAALTREALVAVDGTAVSPALAPSLAMGAALRSYRFDRYRTKEKPEDKPRLEKLTVLADEVGAAKDAWATLAPVAEGVFLCRDLVSEPANVMTPAELADRCKALEKLGVEVEVSSRKDMEKLGFGALLAVAQGSANEPRMVVMRWRGNSKKGKKNGGGKPIAILGKGVTFDTGGISIKPAQGMEDMKWDMAGAAAVIGAMAAIAGREAKAEVVGIVGLVENMPSGNAQRPGDVVTTASGQTVEVINTDAEGRLVLADIAWHCQKEYDPACMIDLATLTGAIIVALGHEYAGLFSSDESLAGKLLAASEASGDKLWRMPLAEAYDKELKSEIADMKNVGGRPGGAITAAHFIQRFVNSKPWAHLDIAGMAWASKDSALAAKGATGFGVRLLDRLVAASEG
jgi:leucyl aminopeptidase